MRLVVYGSFNCPYSYVASRRADRLQAEGIAQVDWRAVVHDPDVPPEGVPVEGELADSIDRELEEIGGLLAPGEEYGFRRPPVQPNTTAAVAGYTAAPAGQADALRAALFDAYWVEGADIGNPVVLYELGCPAAGPSDTMDAWRTEWAETERPVVPMMLLPDGRVSRGLGALARMADMLGAQ